MVRKLTFGVGLVAMVIWTFAASQPAAEGAPPQVPAGPAPIKLARHPDYHAGKVTFLAGRTLIAFSSNRFGNNDVFVISASGGAARQLTFYSGADDVVGWSRDGQQVLFWSAHGDGAFPNVATLYEVPVAGGPEKPLPVD